MLGSLAACVGEAGGRAASLASRWRMPLSQPTRSGCPFNHIRSEAEGLGLKAQHATRALLVCDVAGGHNVPKPSAFRKAKRSAMRLRRT